MAATLAHLIDEKVYPAMSPLGWETPISSILRDDFVMQDAWATAHVTLNDAASHSSGFGMHDGSLMHEKDGKALTARDIVRNIRNLRPATDHRASFIYSNHMYVVLSHVVETLTGSGVGQTIRKYLWDPLGMSSTYFGLQEAVDSGKPIARGYYWDNSTSKHVAIPYAHLDEISGAGAVLSSVTDYTKWISCLLKQGAPLSAAVHQDIRTPRFISVPEPQLGLDITLYSLGWWRTMFQGQTLFEHSGNTPSHGALVWWMPDMQYGVVVFTNTPNFSREIIMRKIVEDRMNIEPKSRYDLAGTVAVLQKQMDDAIAHADDLLYPNRTISTPPTGNIADLAGSYHNDGYGDIEMRVENKDGKDVLVVERPNMTFPQLFMIHHVTGDSWTAMLYPLHASATPQGFGGVKFNFDEKHRPTGFVLTMQGEEMVKYAKTK